jgi:hypothetical protein
VKCIRRTNALGGSYRSELLSSLRKATHEWVERVQRRLNELIEEIRGSHLAGLRSALTEVDLANFGRVRDRLEKVRTVLNATDFHSRQCATPDTQPVGDAVPKSDVHRRCRICVEVQQTVFEYMRHLQYDLSNSESDRTGHAERGGFCGLHTWQYEAIASPQGICSAYPPLLASLSRRLRLLAEWASSPAALREGLLEIMPAVGTCRVCQLILTSERNAARTIVDEWSESGGNSLDEPPPVCLRHLHTILLAKPEMHIARRLIDEEARVLDRLGEDMQRYVLKHEALRRDLTSELENQVHEIALSKLVGLRTLITPWNVDLL